MSNCGSSNDSSARYSSNRDVMSAHYTDPSCQSDEGPVKDLSGSSCSVKRLYYGGKGKNGYDIWLDAPQRDTSDLNTCNETLQHAIVLRFFMTDIPNQQKLKEIVIRNKIMQNLLKPHIPEFSSYLEVAEKGARFVYPFSPLFHHWQTVEAALREQEESTHLSGLLHASLLRRTLIETFSSDFENYKGLIAGNVISFPLLWILFKPGCDLYMASGTSKIVAKCVDSTYSGPADSRKFAVHYKYLTWDGKKYFWVTSSRTISDFAHRKEITNLPVRPLAHDENKDLALAELARRGRVYARLTSQEPQLMMYSGTHDTENEDEQFSWQSRRSIKSTERLMIDSAACYQERSSPAYRTNDLVMTAAEMTLALDSPDQLARNSDTFIYCEPYVQAFGLRSKRWMSIHVHNVSSVLWNVDAWPSLVLPSDYKNLTHAFAKAQLESDQDFDDFMQGKCQGMMMLLSGPPGTGKTLTAEALAEEMKRPLYSMCASELGSGASDVEHALERAFDLAKRWKALILLDEADVFLEKRSDNEIQRNRIVSVFLRKLEYFDSMVFLTTNRPDSFDEAFRSRIHIAIKYTDLTVEARQNVWQRFLDRAEDSAKHGVDIQASDVIQLAKRQLNGREIRNLVKSALLLAWNAREALSLKHIDVVWRIEHAIDGIAV